MMKLLSTAILLLAAEALASKVNCSTKYTTGGFENKAGGTIPDTADEQLMAGMGKRSDNKFKAARSSKAPSIILVSRTGPVLTKGQATDTDKEAQRSYLPDLSRPQHRTAAVAAAALLPVVLPTLYVAYLNWAVRRVTTCTATPPPRTPSSLPKEVAANPDDWVVSCERVVSQPLPAGTLLLPLRTSSASSSTPSPLLTAYLRTTYRAFSWTPQALLIRAMLAEPERRASFAGGYIAGLSFARGDVVDGVYRVTSYEGCRGGGASGEVIELSIDVPRSYRGPPVRGLILSAVEEEEEEEGDGATVRFVNETWLWRKRDEKPTLLETPFGRWFHGLLAGWLVMKGLGGVTRK
ncbi:hypothetical protein ISF_06822 [Cordyceps fumosorosea ARSEF 2679]|uniref:Uncharacterized protein n=1 Tax=Cordyceps fumosorosea (strain ARSEF 2679) TaxID=1081104 RepID=A0A167R5A2_CORFA|nr:hypothetical protein ISF_06822 [Cordyceps fumosorosea ARSEF 2679]OAA58283.1 hypothetical protein ISF_06822 [Cordyceps fumosorosea ARSEF 2679]